MPKKQKDERKLKSIDPMLSMIPFIMPDRTGAMVFINESIPTAPIDEYIKKKHAEGFVNLSFMHVLIAAYVRTVSQRPKINRFIRGQRIWAKRSIEMAMVIKKDMTLDADETTIKFTFSPDNTIEDVYGLMDSEIKAYRENPDEDLEKTLGFLKRIPSALVNIFMSFVRATDYLGIIPKKFQRLSPFHCSLFLTSMGSLGVPSVFHHLYDFGTCPCFLAFGKKNREVKVDEAGNIYKERTIDLSLTLDERICDGFYWASALKELKRILKNPEVLDVPPEKIMEDVA